MKTESHSVEALLGMPGKADTLLDLAYRIEDGLPVGAVERLAGFVAPGDANFKYRLMSKPTYMRRKKARRRLTTEEGNKLARLAKVLSFALGIYKDADRARAFLSRPHPMLDNKPPQDVALATGPGADMVINILGRAAYGGGA